MVEKLLRLAQATSKEGCSSGIRKPRVARERMSGGAQRTASNAAFKSGSSRNSQRKAPPFAASLLLDCLAQRKRRARRGRSFAASFHSSRESAVSSQKTRTVSSQSCLPVALLSLRAKKLLCCCYFTARAAPSLTA